MKILFFSLGYSTHDHRFLKTISENGHEVFFVQLEGNPGIVESRAVPKNIQQVIWKGGRNPFKWSALPALALDFRRVVKKIQPDLIHAGPIQTCAFIAALAGFRPLLTMSWGFDLMDDVHKGKIWQFATRYTLKRSAFFTSDANITREMAIQYGMNPNKTAVFPWGIDLEHFNVPTFQRSNVQTFQRSNADTFTLFCNRSWEKRYGVDVLARAFVKVAQQKDNVDLILLGDGSQGNLIRGILQKGGVLDRVTFGGRVSQNDLPRWYHMADLYISPSHVDGSSVSLMEALGCGLPCLVSDIPANKEWVEENQNGWLFHDGDENQLAEKILAAMNDGQALTRMAKNSRRAAESRADWKKNSAVLMKIYQTVTQA